MSIGDLTPSNYVTDGKYKFKLVWDGMTMASSGINQRSHMDPDFMAYKFNNRRFRGNRVHQAGFEFDKSSDCVPILTIILWGLENSGTFFACAFLMVTGPISVVLGVVDRSFSEI